MNLSERIAQIARIDRLISRKATGSPKNLSMKMGVSERQIYNIINDMKDMGAPIYFCSFRQSYCYKRNVKFKFGFLPEDDSNLISIKGGISSDKFITTSYFEIIKRLTGVPL